MNERGRVDLFSFVVPQLAGLLLADVGQQLAVLLRNTGGHRIIAQPPCQPLHHHTHLLTAPKQCQALCQKLRNISGSCMALRTALI